MNDPHSPTAIEDWQQALPKIKDALGLTDILIPYVGYVFLEAKDRSSVLNAVSC